MNYDTCMISLAPGTALRMRLSAYDICMSWLPATGAKAI